MKCFEELKINIDLDFFEWVNLLNYCWIHRQVRVNLANWNIIVARGKRNNNNSHSSGEQNKSNLNRENGVVGEQYKCCVVRQSN